MTLADLIAPGPGRVRMHFPAESISLEYGSLWAAGEAMGCLKAATDEKPVAIALSNTYACAAALVGAITVGQSILSVPMPPRGADLAWYSQFVEGICRTGNASTMLLDSSLLRMIPPMAGITLLPFEEALALRGPRVADPASFVLTQFTSGSTADPKGVVLSAEKIAANLRAIIDWIQPQPGDGVCSWLPLSHDMGLIGMFLCSIAGSAGDWPHNADHVFLTPQVFLRKPGNWLAAIEEFKATVTASPNYGYEMTARLPGSARDLSRLRVCIAGAEPIRVNSLERFADSLRGSGFNSRAFCPAYGMAEAVLAVTATPPAAHWRSTELDPVTDNARGAADSPQRSHVVSCGPVLPGYQLRIDDADTGGGTGEILVKGPSVGLAYADGTPIVDDAGWYHTRDLGTVRDGELYVLGRTDDLLFVAGRNIYALDVEAYANEITGIRSGRAVAIPENGALTIVAECEPGFSDQSSAHRLAQQVRQHIVNRIGLAPRRVLLTRRGALPMTASGKIRRNALVASVQSAQLKILAGSLD